MTKSAAQEKNHNAYDEVPYESFSYPHTQPPALYTAAKLFNMNPPDFKTARVLELGCASGGNILPLALLYPKAKFHGIDLSARQIEDGKNHIKALKIKNLTLEQMDIMKFPEDAGEYDYIICHGILSWVPGPVQDKILEILAKHLKPNGLAHLSYNCLPGWRFISALREMMKFHTDRFNDPKDVITQARVFLDFIHDNAGHNQDGYKAIIDTERQNLKNSNDSYLFHDHLEENNKAFYLHEINSRLVAAGLQYVGDTHIPSMYAGNISRDAAAKLGGLSDVVQQEQYLDFLNNRRFRNSIICKAGVAIDRNIRHDAYEDFYLKPLFRPLGGAPDKNAPLAFQRIGADPKFTVATAGAKALFLEMCENNGAPVDGRTIVSRAAKAHKVPEDQVRLDASQNIMRLFLSGYIQMMPDGPDYIQKLSDKPAVFALARHECGLPQTHRVTNMLRDMVSVDAPARIILALADGTRTIKDIAEGFLAAIESRGEHLQEKGQNITDPKRKSAAALEFANAILEKAKENALLVG